MAKKIVVKLSDIEFDSFFAYSRWFYRNPSDQLHFMIDEVLTDSGLANDLDEEKAQIPWEESFDAMVSLEQSEDPVD